jgi:hypothetical protein
MDVYVNPMLSVREALLRVAIRTSSGTFGDVEAMVVESDAESRHCMRARLHGQCLGV